MHTMENFKSSNYYGGCLKTSEDYLYDPEFKDGKEKSERFTSLLMVLHIMESLKIIQKELGNLIRMQTAVHMMEIIQMIKKIVEELYESRWRQALWRI